MSRIGNPPRHPVGFRSALAWQPVSAGCRFFVFALLLAGTAQAGEIRILEGPATTAAPAPAAIRLIGTDTSEAADATVLRLAPPPGIAPVSYAPAPFAFRRCMAPANVRLRLNDYVYEIADASQRYGVHEALVRAVIHVESAFRPTARSPKAAQGLMQLIPATASRFGVTDPWDPAQNISGGVQYLAWLLRYFDGDMTKALAGYNAGEGAVRRYHGVPPYRETQAYVVRVQQLYEAYLNALAGGITLQYAPPTPDGSSGTTC